MKIAKKEVGLTLAGHYAKGMFPALYTRHERFPGGENLDDVLGRAEAFVEEVVVPLVMRERDEELMAEEKEDKEGGGRRLTVVVVSHGLFIPELVAAVLKKDASLKTGGVDVKGLRGMKNTAWTRVEAVFKVCKNSSFLVFWFFSKWE
jgi:broad specificity phosphatase PhoE